VRIGKHPIIEDYAKGETVRFFFEGREVKGQKGEPIAAALRALGIQIHRYTVKRHEPRGISCAIGRCTDCVMVVDGFPNVRTCVTPLAEGMKVAIQDGLSTREASSQSLPGEARR
jgi:predicted molibdopterin-dependent oxidoreductase YjgC